ncbi:MAG: DUF4139 domain-containing protein [Candidatus Melainabacteria bacterium]|jgi:hypothetical protein|nr:DUF4139 domain-containing protein [Candidatus Melainabacteria bacterium]
MSLGYFQGGKCVISFANKKTGVRRAASLTALLAFCQVSLPVLALDEKKISESSGVSLTVYNQNFGLVRDTRSVELGSGINHVRFEDVAAKIDPTSVSFTSLTAPNQVVVREQNYQYDLIEPTTILSKSVGKDVRIKNYLAGGGVSDISGTLINSPRTYVSDAEGRVSSTYSGLVVKTGNGVILNPQGQVELSELPAGLVPKPSLLWKLETDKAGMHKTEIAYQTAGLNWKCDYVAVVNSDDTKTDLTSWVTLDNQSGASYRDAALKLLAGDVHRVTQPQTYHAKGMLMGRAAAAEQQFTEQSFAEYHLYTLAGKTDVKDRETKQLSLFNAAQIPTKKQFVFDSTGQFYAGGWTPYGANKKINVKLEMENSEKNNLGMPMPKGKVRVYKKDKDGALQFIGEDQIDHTPRDEKIRLYIGDAFDVVGERKQMNVQRVSDRVTRVQMELSLRNHKKEPVTVTAVEHAYGQWKIINSSQDYRKKDSTTFEFDVKVAPDSETKVTYEIEMKY